MTAAPAAASSPPPSRPLWQGRAVALVGIVLLALSLRSAVASLSPVLTRIGEDMSLHAWVIGLIGTAPPVCFAVFGILTPGLERRFGLERLATVTLVIVALATVARGFAPNEGLLLASTVLIFAASGVGNVLLPPLVKTYFPDRIGLMTTIYTTTMSISTFLPPLLAVPVADASSWRVSLGMWAAFSAVAAVPWLILVLRSRRDPDEVVDEPNPSVLGRLWRLPLPWALVVGFSVSSATAYTLFAWLPKILVDEAGVTPAVAGALLSLFAIMGLPVSLVVPLLVTRYRIVGPLFAVAVAVELAGLAGLLFAPATLTWLWVALVGLGPLLFPLILVLVGLRTRTHEASVALSGFVQSGGYAIAAAFPFAVGVLHDVTGDWEGPLWLLVALTFAAIPAGIVAARSQTVEQQWERRRGSW